MERRCLRCGVISPADAVACPACGTALPEMSDLAGSLQERSAAPWIPVQGGSVPAEGVHSAPPPLPHAPVLHHHQREQQVPAYVGSPTRVARRNSPLQSALIVLAVAAVVAGAVWGIIRFADSLTTGRAADTGTSDTAVASNTTWSAFADPEGTFTVDMPSAPIVASSNGTRTFSAGFPNRKSNVFLEVLPPPEQKITRANANAYLGPVAFGATNQLAATASTFDSTQVVDAGGRPALDVDMTTPTGKLSVRVLATGSHTFVLAALQHKDDGPLVGLDWARFRDSFKLL